jgi:hypothetical protein
MTSPTPEIIATWPVPDYDNPRGIQTGVEAVLYATTIVMLLFVGSRVFVRVRSKNMGMAMDDWFVVAGAVRTANTCILRKSNWHSCLLVWKRSLASIARNML